MPTIKQLADELGFSYSDIAKAIGLSRQRVATLGHTEVRGSRFVSTFVAMARERRANLDSMIRDLATEGQQDMLCRTTYGPDGVATTNVLDQETGETCGFFRWRPGDKPPDGMGLLSYKPLGSIQLPTEECMCEGDEG
jgi:hypothetical protein